MKKVLIIICVAIVAVFALSVLRQTGLFYDIEKTTNDAVQEFFLKKEKKVVYCNKSVTYRTPNDSSVTYFLHKRDHAFEKNMYYPGENYELSVSGPFDVDSIIDIYNEDQDTFVLCNECFNDSTRLEVVNFVKNKGKRPNVEIREISHKY